jgi:hypothetical protein
VYGAARSASRDGPRQSRARSVAIPAARMPTVVSTKAMPRVHVLAPHVQAHMNRRSGRSASGWGQAEALFRPESPVRAAFQRSETPIDGDILGLDDSRAQSAERSPPPYDSHALHRVVPVDGGQDRPRHSRSGKSSTSQLARLGANDISGGR